MPELPLLELPDEGVEGPDDVEALSVEDLVSDLVSDFDSDLLSDLASDFVSVEPPSLVFLPSLNLSE